MLFLMGPRQVGKTTLCRGLDEEFENYMYFTWDAEEDQELILQGSGAVARALGLPRLAGKLLITFDEIHKYKRWKLFLKGLYDKYMKTVSIVVTGSARLDVFCRGGDSLMGRYLSYRVHPLSVAELIDPHTIPRQLISPSRKLPQDQIAMLLKFGGFPDPLLKQDQRFYNRWKALRHQQLFREDLRDLTHVQSIDQLELLAEMIRRQVGQQTSYGSLAKKIRVADTTVRNWIKILQSFYYCFELRPWSKNVVKSLLKEPKYYLWDWSQCADEGSRSENLIASHLLKAVHFWNDHGFGEFSLHYLRDKNKREVDFIVIKEGKPWFIVEVKNSLNHGISPALHYYFEQLKPEYAFQVVMDQPYVEADCFSHNEPVIVPAATFLSQLV
ncbi:MAG: ATP-binding protein [Chlamydiia bacterium]|nr:ATP-binding protein [Chlamydiia bacterium]